MRWWRVCIDKMSAATAHCPDCAAPLLVPCCWCPDEGVGLHPMAITILLDHARQHPILHPTVLPHPAPT